MADQRLPQKDELVTPNDDLLIHVVDPNDISHYPTGTSKKMSRADFLGTQFAQLFTSLLDAPNTYTGNGLKTSLTFSSTCICLDFKSPSKDRHFSLSNNHPCSTCFVIIA